MGLSGHYDGIPETVFYNVILKKDKKADIKQNTQKKKLLCFNVDRKQHEHKIPYSNTFLNSHSSVPDTNTCFFFVRIPYFFGKSTLKNGDVLTNLFFHVWGRFDQPFFHVWGRFDQFGDILTRGRFD